MSKCVVLARWLGVVLVLCALGGYVWSVSALSSKERSYKKGELSVYFPPIAQLIGAGGDRYLAANAGVFRTFMVGTDQLSPKAYEILARIHSDAALFNPGHEDNYYVAAAILPWAGHVAEAQYVLSRAMQVRPHDYMPPLLFAFHQRHFKKNGVAAANTLRAAAPLLTDEKQRLAFEVMAARWYEMAEGEAAAAMLRLMAEQTRSADFARYLYRRAERLDAVASLEVAVAEWKDRHGSYPISFDKLIDGGLLKQLPRDPFNGTFTLSPDGKVLVVDKKKDGG